MINKYWTITIGMSLIALAQAGPYDSWAKYRDITVNTTSTGANVAGTVVNFPVLVRLSNTGVSAGSDVLTEALALGADLRFTDSTGNTDLPYEIEQWSSSSAAIWVKLPSVTGNASTRIRLFWGKAGASAASNASAVFDTASGFRAVYHLNDATGDSARDATINNYKMEAGTVGAAGMPTDTAGVIGQGKDFLGGGGASNNSNGSYYRIRTANAPRLNFIPNAAQYSISLWLMPDSAVGGTASGARQGIVNKYSTTGTTAQQYGLVLLGNASAPTQRFQASHKNPASTVNGSFITSAAVTQAWQHVTFTRTGPATADQVIYIDGVSAQLAVPGSEGQGSSDVADVVIGAYSDLLRFFKGKIDEVRFDSTARSADWVKLNYETQKAGSSAVALGTTQIQSVATAPGAPTNLSGVSGNMQVTVSWVAPASNGGAAITGYKAMVVGDTAKTCATTGALTCTITGLVNGTSYTFIVKATNSVGTGVASAASAAVIPAAPGGYGAWSLSRTITLNTTTTGANVAGTVTNFPVLIRLSAAESTFFAQAKAGGADIRFSKANGTTALPYQIERWDGTVKRAEIWVLVDTVRGDNSTQNIRMYWGNASASSESNGAAVFPDAGGYRAVYHLADANDSAARDASSNGYHAVPGNVAAVNPASISGAIGTAKNFAGIGGTSASGSYYKVPSTNTTAPRLNFRTDSSHYTLSAWILSDALPAVGTAGRQGILAKYGSVANQQFVMGLWGSASGTGATCATAHKMAATGGRYQEAQDCAASPGAWTHIAATRSGIGAGSVELYVNGEPAGTEGAEGAGNFSVTSDLFIGAFSDTTRFFDGAIDEVRLDSTARSADYLKLSYESQKPNQAFTNIGAPVVAIPGVPTAVMGVMGDMQVTVSWAAPASNGGGTITGYKAMVVGDTAKTCATTGALTCTITGLVNGTSYTFIVKATNSAGTSAASAASAPVTPGPTALNPGAFVIRVSGAEKPYAFQLPLSAVATTEIVTLSIVDTWGRTVWVKTINPSRTQEREVAWNGKSSNGRQVSAGMYIVRVRILSAGKTTHLVQKSVTLNP